MTILAESLSRLGLMISPCPDPSGPCAMAQSSSCVMVFLFDVERLDAELLSLDGVVISPFDQRPNAGSFGISSITASLPRS